MDVGSVECIANIGQRERSKRLRIGAAAFAFSLVLAATLVAAGVGPAWRLALVVPLWVAALGYFQARDKT